MVVFLIIYTVIAYISYKLITAKLTRELRIMQKEEEWSENRVAFSGILFPIANILGIVMFIAFVLPMTLDIPRIVMDNDLTHDGPVNGVECKLLCVKQVVHIDEDIELDYYFRGKLDESESFEIKYLPKSKFITGLKVQVKE